MFFPQKPYKKNQLITLRGQSRIQEKMGKPSRKEKIDRTQKENTETDGKKTERTMAKIWINNVYENKIVKNTMDLCQHNQENEIHNKYV